MYKKSLVNEKYNVFWFHLRLKYFDIMIKMITLILWLLTYDYSQEKYSKSQESYKEWNTYKIWQQREMKEM